jgi:hypothetical protein
MPVYRYRNQVLRMQLRRVMVGDYFGQRREELALQVCSSKTVADQFPKVAEIAKEVA